MPKHPFDYHRPNADQVARITAIREGCKTLFDLLNVNVAACPKRTIALRKLEEVLMWANKAIVLEPGTEIDPAQSPRPLISPE